MDKMLSSEFYLSVGKFCMFCVHVMYSPCSKLQFSTK